MAAPTQPLKSPADFNIAIAVWRTVEGGYSSDAGGTMFGIIQSTYDNYRRRHGLPIRPVRDIDKDIEVPAILQENYWTPFNCAGLPQPWANFLLVEGGNLPFGGAAKIMQQALAWLGYYKGDIDGDVGPMTIAAAKLAPTRVDVAIKGALGHYAVEGEMALQKGFRRRLADLRAACLTTESKNA